MSYLRFTKRGTSQKLLHSLKYRNKPEIGIELGTLYGYLLKNNGFEFNWDMVVPVPLHPEKQRRRSYNQSEQFAIGIASVLGIPMQLGLVRTQFTETQTKKSRMERINNVSEVFAINKNVKVEGVKILLVDDVMTTGATLTSCANVLLESNAVLVDLAVIAAGKF
ncbi:ComF family protein [Belliella alkalica]